MRWVCCCQAKEAAAEQWRIKEQARLKKQEEARQQAVKDAKARKAKERDAEIKRKAAELKAKVKAEVEEVCNKTHATNSIFDVFVAPGKLTPASLCLVCWLSGGSNQGGPNKTVQASN